jgi:hypothetical protein
LIVTKRIATKLHADFPYKQMMPSKLVIRTAALVSVFALIYTVFLFLPPIQALREIDYFLPLHTIMETFAVVVSCMIFGIIWNTCDISRSRNIVLLGAAFLADGHGI